jgi:PKHD-type hydroxylase
VHIRSRLIVRQIDIAPFADRARAMLIAIPDLLSSVQLSEMRAIVDTAAWIDGNATSGPQAALAKRNEQLPEDSDAARRAGAIVLDALSASPLFVAAALPLKVFPPLFNRYAGGQAFATHIDNAIRIKRGSDFRIRSDLSATLFLADPDSYDGGELMIEGQYGEQTVKLPAGHMILYPASSRHRVTPVTRGVRVASFFWIQSMIRDDSARAILFELDSAVQAVAGDRGQGDPAVVQLTGVYHNLLRRWADA